MFAPLNGVSEDPATGRANAALGGDLASMAKQQDGTWYSKLFRVLKWAARAQLRVTVEKKKGFMVRVQVGGSCVR